MTLKKLAFVVMLGVLTLTACGAVSDVSSDSEPETAAKQSYIRFAAGEDLSDAQLDAAAQVIGERFAGDFVGVGHTAVPEYDTDCVRLDFDYDPSLEEQLAEFTEKAVGKNQLEFRIGSGSDGAVILTSLNVDSAYASGYLTDTGDMEFCIVVELDAAGTAAFAEATAELAGTDTPIAIWLDSELLAAPFVSSAITDGKAVITGNFDSDSAAELAGKISSPLPFDMRLENYEFNEE